MTIKYKHLKPLTDEEEAQIQRQIASDPDAPEATDEQLAQARPFADVFPELAEKMRKNLGGRPPVENPKRAISIRLDPDVIAKLKEGGEGWQSKLNATLREALSLNGGLGTIAAENAMIVKAVQDALPTNCKATHISPFGLGAQIYRIEVPCKLEARQKLAVENAVKVLKKGNNAFYIDWVVVAGQRVEL